MSYGKIWCEKVRLIKKRILGKGHQMTRVLQPQRERGRSERENERAVELFRWKYNVSNKNAQEARYHDAANDMCSHFTMVIPTHIAEKARYHHSSDEKKRDALIQRRFYTHRRFYTQRLLHTDSFTHRRFYTQTPLHTDTFTHRHFYAQTLLRTEHGSDQTILL